MRIIDKGTKTKMNNEQIEIVKQIATKLAKSYTYPGFDIKDAVQFALMAVEKVVQEGKYDNGRPFPNFAYTHIKNRLFNNKRDKWVRFVKNKVAMVSQLNYDPQHFKNVFDDKLDKIEIEEMLDTFPVSLRSTILRMINQCKISTSKRNELKEWTQKEGLNSNG